jgi:hypothetical protein
LLDCQLPRFDARQVSTVVVDADTERTYEAVRGLDPDQVARSFPLVRLMGWLRGLPARMPSFSRHEKGQPDPQALPADEYREAFVVIDEEPGMEFVVGMIGKFMTSTQLEFRHFASEEFSSFVTPGFGKVALNFLVQPYGATRSLLLTETRTTTTDPVSKEHVRRYWKLIGPFAGLIMRRWLALAKHRAERGEASRRDRW